MTSSVGAAVEFSGAKADSSGVTGRAVFVREGSGRGIKISVGVAVDPVTQAFRRKMEIRKQPIIIVFT
jgi:hypothetical protein